jgi:hypothetical protein
MINTANSADIQNMVVIECPLPFVFDVNVLNTGLHLDNSQKMNT